jgi:hypothetical protein
VAVFDGDIGTAVVVGRTFTRPGGDESPASGGRARGGAIDLAGEARGIEEVEGGTEGTE